MKKIFLTFKESAHKGTALSTQLECNLKILTETQENLLQSQRKIMELCEKLENLQLVVDSEEKENAILKRNIESLKEHAISEDAKQNFEKELESFTAKNNAGIMELCYQFVKKNHEKLYQQPQLEDPSKNNSVKENNSTPGKKKKKQKDQNIVVFGSITEINQERELCSVNWPNLGGDPYA